MSRKLIASVKPNEHKVYVGKHVFVYGRVRKKTFVDKRAYVHNFLSQIAKITLKRVKEICK